MSCLAETDGDDPDFVRSDTPAAAFSSAGACQTNCVDPTTACVDGACAKSYTCNASSSCDACSEQRPGEFPLHLAGLELSAGYAPGGHVFEFADDLSAVTVTPPAGASSATPWSATLSNWLYDASASAFSGTWTLTETGTVLGARMAVYDGALGRNVRAHLPSSFPDHPLMQQLMRSPPPGVLTVGVTT